MKRTIKFRVWDPSLKQFIKRNVGLDNAKLRITLDGIIESECEFGYEVHSKCILQQFTNMIDVTGQDIYEGDIIEVCGYKGEKVPVEVQWEETWGSDDMGYDTVGYKTLDERGTPRVIGNIFENPDLLEKKKVDMGTKML